MKTGIEVMENNLENKAKFFAQYWGVKCLKNELLKDHIPPHKVGIENCKGLPQQFLELTPLSQISEEDYNKLHNVNGYIIEDRVLNTGHNSVTIYYKWDDKEMTGGFGKSASTIYFDSLSQIGSDYLRSKGYALPFNGLSIETLVKYGWIKLKQ